MKNASIGFVALIGMAVATPGHAFNIKNNTAYPVCARSHTGDYMEIVGPGETSKGWYTDKTLEVALSPYDETVTDDKGGVYINCNENVATRVTVPPHVQVSINHAYFLPGDVGENDPKLQWTMFMVLDAPARYDYNLQ